MPIQTLRLHHASQHDFDFPDFEKITANTTNHINGFLGLWVSVQTDWIEGFGERIYEMDVVGECRDMPVSELAKWNRQDQGEPDFYARIRETMLEEGVAYLRLIELDGRSEMGVVLDLSAIQHFRRMDAPSKSANPCP
jgi:hypothetical protein